MTAGVFHSIWLHGRYHGDKTCREILTSPYCAGMTPVELANSAHKKSYHDFLATLEADETVRVVLARYGSAAID